MKPDKELRLAKVILGHDIVGYQPEHRFLADPNREPDEGCYGLPAYSLDEAAALCADVYPWFVPAAGLLPRDSKAVAKVIRFGKVLSAAERAQKVGDLEETVRLKDFLRWADKAGVDVSPRLRTVIGGDPSAAPLGTKERTTLLTIIASMAVSAYKYTPGKPNDATTRIVTDLAKNGASLDPDTVRAKIVAGMEFLSPPKG